MYTNRELGYELFLAHHGIKGMKWGVRRYQNADGTLTAKGKKHALKTRDKVNKALNRNDINTAEKAMTKQAKKAFNKDDISKYKKYSTEAKAAGEKLKNATYFEDSPDYDTFLKEAHKKTDKYIKDHKLSKKDFSPETRNYEKLFGSLAYDSATEKGKSLFDKHEEAYKKKHPEFSDYDKKFDMHYDHMKKLTDKLVSNFSDKSVKSLKNDNSMTDTVAYEFVEHYMKQKLT